jgi:hypothetical protein
MLCQVELTIITAKKKGQPVLSLSPARIEIEFALRSFNPLPSFALTDVLL